jgi:glycosyltransferase involved in cell wall biosynthesis
MKASIVLATSTGGMGTHVASLVERLPALGIDIAVVSPAATETQFGFRARGAGFTPVEITTLPRPREDLAAVRLLRAALVGADVVHAHGLRATSLTALAVGRRRPGRTPLVATWHNALLGSGMRRVVLGALERLSARRADVTLGASADLVARAAHLGAPAARLLPVAAPAMAAPSRDPAEVRAELGAEDRPLVLAVGRLAPQKDYDTLLAAAASWQTRSPSPVVAVAGDGPERGRLQGVIDAQRLEVRLLGHRDDVPDLLAASDIYVLTSTWEARALVVQEAMRAGVPVVATAVGGVPELVGDAAVLVPPADAASLARAVEDLLDSPDDRAELARQGRDRAIGWPDEDDTARAVAAVYREIVGG